MPDPSVSRSDVNRKVERWTLEKRPSGWFVLRGRAIYHEVVEVMSVAEHEAAVRQWKDAYERLLKTGAINNREEARRA